MESMITLLKNIECYGPMHIGKKNLLLVEEKIHAIAEPNTIAEGNPLIDKLYDCEGLLAFPGLLDQHVHIIGGGGEDGFASRIPEIAIEDIIKAGVTTLVGVLGVDSFTRDLTSLVAKARALQQQGITTYVYTGSYAVPTVTLTGSIAKDLVLIDKIIGTGEIAISDHRASPPLLSELMKLSAETHIGGLLGMKAGVVHIHVGEGKDGLEPLLQMIEESDLPLEQFVPTHVNRTRKLFRQAIDYCKKGGCIDLTAGQSKGLGDNELDGVTVPDAVQWLIRENISLSKVTISSDANGSIPNHGVGRIQTLFDDLISCIHMKIPVEMVFSLVTKNVAQILKLYPQKGALKEGSDADILILDQAYRLQKLFCKGQLRLDNGKLIEPK